MGNAEVDVARLVVCDPQIFLGEIAQGEVAGLVPLSQFAAALVYDQEVVVLIEDPLGKRPHASSSSSKSSGSFAEETSPFTGRIRIEAISLTVIRTPFARGFFTRKSEK
ncbi:MAG: hypothetical protein BWY50_01776 [Spirochaetes bacterium ADurb.Bin315]|nr:MAG: hypothetical protein BWY50_01776 [Spirochaetes bacterium ADurb.Bin315]